MKSNQILSFLIVLFSFFTLINCGKNKPLATYNVKATTNKDYRIEGPNINENKNPTITLKRGETYEFVVDAFDHPFFIKTEKTTGSTNTYNEGVTNNGTNEGIILFSVSKDAPSILYYVCKYHKMMGGELKITD